MNANLCICMHCCKWMENCIGCWGHMFKIVVLLNDDSSVWKRLSFVLSAHGHLIQVFVCLWKLQTSHSCFLRDTRCLHLMVNPLRLWLWGLLLIFDKETCLSTSWRAVITWTKKNLFMINVYLIVHKTWEFGCNCFVYYKLQYSC